MAGRTTGIKTKLRAVAGVALPLFIGGLLGVVVTVMVFSAATLLFIIQTGNVDSVLAMFRAWGLM